MADERKYKYETLTPANEVIRIFDRLGACSKSQEWYNKYKDKTFGELVSGCLDDEFRVSWAIWYLKLFGKDTCPVERKKFLSVITDPMQCLLANYQFDFIDDEDRRTLKQHYSGRITRAESEILSLKADKSDG